MITKVIHLQIKQKAYKFESEKKINATVICKSFIDEQLSQRYIYIMEKSFYYLIEVIKSTQLITYQSNTKQSLHIVRSIVALYKLPEQYKNRNRNERSESIVNIIVEDIRYNVTRTTYIFRNRINKSLNILQYDVHVEVGRLNK